MVHALREAHRVLKPAGLLLDLRPGPVHRRVGIEVEGEYRQLAIMSESLDDDYAANRAVDEVIHEDWFKLISGTQFNCNRVMALKDFASWLDDFSSDRRALQQRLIRKVEDAFLAAKGKNGKVLVKGPLVLKVLQKERESST